MGKLIFVYGTLKSGFRNHHVLADSGLLGSHTTEPVYTMKRNNHFPIVERGGAVAIKGEVYHVQNEGTLQSIYNLEGYTGVQHSPKNWYDTDTIRTPYGNASIFVMDEGKNDLPIVEDGVFK